MHRCFVPEIVLKKMGMQQKTGKSNELYVLTTHTIASLQCLALHLF